MLLYNLRRKINIIFDNFYVWREIIPMFTFSVILFINSEMFLFIDTILVKYDITMNINNNTLILFTNNEQIFLIYFTLNCIANWVIIYYSLYYSGVLLRKHYNIRKMSSLSHFRASNKSVKFDKCMEV